MMSSGRFVQGSVKLGICFSLLSAVTYGLNPILAKFGYLTGLEGIEVLHGRFIFATIILAIVGPVLEKGFYKFSKELLVNACIIAVLILLPMNLLYVYALKDIPASMMSLITYVYPLVVLLINFFIFKRQIFSRQWVSVFLIILGCGCIFSDAFSLQVSTIALVLGFLSMLMYALYLISLQQLATNVSALQITFVTIAIATAGLCLFHNPLLIADYSLPQLGVSFIYGLVSTVMSTIFLSKAIQLLGATEAGIFCSFEPAFTILFASTLLGEVIPTFRWLGLLLLVLAIVLPNAKVLVASFVKTK